MKKNMMFFLITCVLFYLVIEAFCFIFLKESNTGELPMGLTMPPGTERIEVLHPYFGFVYNPETNSQGYFDYHKRIPVSDYGFLDNKLPFYNQSDDRVIIGIFGGSFAWWFSKEGIGAMISELKKAPFFKNKEIIIIRTALGGYKQPQQLIILNYLLALGANFDLIINIDGFNEAALPIAENIPKGIFPFYPRGWFSMIEDRLDPKIQNLIIEALYITKKRDNLSVFFSKKPVCYSPLLRLLHNYFDENLKNKLFKIQLAILNEREKTNRYIVTGPPFHPKDASDLNEALALVWKRSSLQMHKVCLANSIIYFHFLQPNQYVKNSKIMKTLELKLAFDSQHPYRTGVEGVYPYLIKLGRELSNEGVNFYDLTMIFKDNDTPLYRDTACHINEEGNNIVGKTIGRIIIKEMGYSD